MIGGTHGATVPMNEMYPTWYLNGKRYKDTARVSIVHVSCLVYRVLSVAHHGPESFE